MGNGARTHDTRNHNPVLCQLSYTHHIQFFALRPPPKPARPVLVGKERALQKRLWQMARLKGLEPLTHCLEGSCSIHLSYRRILCAFRDPEPPSLREKGPTERANFRRSRKRGTQSPAPTLERVMGIEPTRPAWKAGILPLNYTRMVGHIRKCQLG